MRRGVIAAGPGLLTAIGLAAAQPPADPPAVLPPVVETKPQTPQPVVPAPSPEQCGPAGAAAPDSPPRWVDRHQGPSETAWLGLNYGYWRIKDGPQPFPLATTGTGAFPGVLGQQQTNVVVGGSDLDFDTFAGFALNGGLWLNNCHTAGVYFGAFVTEQASTGGAVASDALGGPVIARPFTDALTNRQSALLVSFPGVLAGGLEASANARLGGAEGGMLRNLYQNDSYTVNFLLGYRYLDLDEDLSVVQVSQRIDGGVIPFAGTAAPAIRIEDRFHTRNQFYGGQIGAQAEYRFGSIVAGLTYKVSLGTNHEVVEVIGQTTGIGGAAGGSPGGFLALPGGNAGRDTNNRFVVLPEVGGRLGWQVNRWLRLNAGYDFLYLNDVARPGTQIDPVINQKLVPVSPAFGTASGPNVPMRPARIETFYAHGAQVGVEVRY